MNGVGLIAVVAAAIVAGEGGATRLDTAVKANRCSSPHGRVTPGSGPAATRFRFRGRCFPRDTRAYGVFLIRFFKKSNCEVIVGGRSRIRVNKRRIGRGWIEPDAAGGHCFQSTQLHKLTPGVYSIGVGCHPCEFAKIRITAR